jgi:hypothetical protein
MRCGEHESGDVEKWHDWRIGTVIFIVTALILLDRNDKTSVALPGTDI